MPGLVSQQHHHRSTTKTDHKPFKSRFASKNAIRDRSKGRTERLEKGQRKSPHQQVMSKLDRRNQAKQQRLVRQGQHDRARSIFQGKDGAPRIVAVIPLTDDIDPQTAIGKLNESLDIEPQETGGQNFVQVDRFKQRLQYVPARRGLYEALDACRAADYTICLLSAQEEVDEYGELVLRSIESQGISNVYTIAAHLDKIEPPKKRPQTIASLKSFITHFFADQEKVFSLDAPQECQNVVRSLCTTTPKGINWRSNRSWMYIEEMSSSGKAAEGAEPELVLTGVVRGRNLKADRVVRLNHIGEFQIARIEAAPRPQPLKASKEKYMMAVDADAKISPNVLDAPTEDQDTLDTLAPEEVVMDEAANMDARSVALTERKSVLLDEDYATPITDEENEPQAPRRLPKGTSNYQAAWYIGDEAEYDSDFESDDDAQAEGDIEMDTAPDLVTVGGPSSASAADPDPMDASTTAGDDAGKDEEAGDLAEYRARKRGDVSAAEADRQFPDEIELPPHVAARERLAKYRGLKSARTSPWTTEQDKPHEPSTWARLLDVADPKAAKARVLNEALVGGVPAGRRVAVHLRGASAAVARALADTTSLGSTPGAPPAQLTSLLRHEHKHTAMHATLTIPRDFGRPLRNRERVLVQVGPRRIAIAATLSQPGATPNDVHRVLRWAWPGDTVVVSWTGPVTWGAVPVVFFASPQAASTGGDDDNGINKSSSSAAQLSTASDPAALTLLGAGTLLPPSTTRVLAKRAVLTGQPYALHRRQTHVRHMFFSAADVAYFAALPLWTTRGRRGAIKESLGTHGQFKAAFDGRVNPQEAVAISLWKRVWPRPSDEGEGDPAGGVDLVHDDDLMA